MDRGRPRECCVFLNGKPLDCTVVHDALSGAPASQKPLEIGDRNLGVPYQGQIADLRVYDRPLTQKDAAILAVDEPVRAILLQEPGKRSKDQRQTLQHYFLSNAAPQNLRAVYSDYLHHLTGGIRSTG